MPLLIRVALHSPCVFWHAWKGSSGVSEYTVGRGMGVAFSELV